MEEITWTVDFNLCHLMGIKAKFMEIIWSKIIDGQLSPAQLPRIKIKYCSVGFYVLFLDGKEVGHYEEKEENLSITLKFTPIPWS